LLTVKTFGDAEGRVVEHVPGRGRHAGRLDAIVVELPGWLTFSVGTGFTDDQRRNPPSIGSLIKRVRININRHFLARALQLGLSEFCLLR
jgi:hypothetical protein